MKKIRKFVSKPWMVCLLAISFLNLACNTERLGDSYQQDAKEYTGEELFKSIIFLDGEATHLFPVLSEQFNVSDEIKSEQEKEAFEIAKNDAVNFIAKNNPDFFSNFKKDLYSKDPYIIQEAIKSAVAELTPFLSQKMKQNGMEFTYDLKNKENAGELKKKLDHYISLNKNDNKAEEATIVLAYAVAVVVAVAFYVVAISEFEIGVVEAGQEQLMMEELSLSISNNL